VGSERLENLQQINIYATLPKSSYEWPAARSLRRMTRSILDHHTKRSQEVAYIHLLTAILTVLIIHVIVGGLELGKGHSEYGAVCRLSDAGIRERTRSDR
jgi:hypothetical protein